MPITARKLIGVCVTIGPKIEKGAGTKTFYHKLKDLKKSEASSLKEVANRISEETRKSRPEMVVIKGLFALLKENGEVAAAAKELENEILSE
ncbi:hypothetical protein [Cytobacillus firmus]|jgi:hypothetical protein|uniref:hypothetical protein n=1 Tax=Cytobacillus firmus TaxID=1399 RepID=UPI0021616A35|nr:hypothetical protein [Cytobacillus firmus]MCS0673987.1 hypothetical protein [Cytobacillus firmus]